MKRQLLVEVDCGDVICGECSWYDRKGEACTMFEQRLVDGMVRDPYCIKVEDKAKELRRSCGGLIEVL